MVAETKSTAWTSFAVRRWRIEVLSGPSRGTWIACTDGTLRIGSAPDNELVIEDPHVSRHHLRIEVEPGALRVRDLGSKNGTLIGGARVAEANLPAAGGVVQLGDSRIGFAPFDDQLAIAPTTADRCHDLVGGSVAMRGLFAQVQRVAPTNASVLITGETGTGKELVARALHHHSRRRERPLVVVDCATLPANLIESELFGHVRGAFTGATADHAGAFARADGGTVFLDEIGELPLDVQPKLLRVLESGELRPVGSPHVRRVDLRVVAATHRDLLQRVADGHFRQDLYYRLAVVVLEVPPLRARLDDLALLVETLAERRGWQAIDPVSLARLQHSPWPGNVRQLANVLERAAAMHGGALTIGVDDLVDEAIGPDGEVPYKQAKAEVVARFTRDYVAALLARHGGNASAAARAAGLDRNWLTSLARRHGVALKE